MLRVSALLIPALFQNPNVTEENKNMLIAYQVALEVVRELRPLVEQIKKHDNNLAKQLVDAANSTVQNLAEGERHRGGNKRAKFDIAHGEANEMKGSLDVALAWGYIADDSAARVKLRRLLALCWGPHERAASQRKAQRCRAVSHRHSP